MRFLGAIAGFAIGMATGILIVFGGYQIWVHRLGGYDREGAAGMAVFFFYGPVAGLLSGLAGAILFWRRLARRDR